MTKCDGEHGGDIIEGNFPDLMPKAQISSWSSVSLGLGFVYSGTSWDA